MSASNATHDTGTSHETLSLQDVVKALLDVNHGCNFHIEAVYLFGSRLYGVNILEMTPNDTSSCSDYDFIIITNRSADREHCFPSCRLPDDSRLTLELVVRDKYHLDCVVMDISSFLLDTFIEQHNYKAILPLWLSDTTTSDYVWFETPLMKLIRKFWLANLNVRLRQIQRGLTLWCRITAKRSFYDGDLRRCRKNLLHSIRYLKYAYQIVDQYQISKYRNAKKFHTLFFENTKDFTTWDQYEQVFRPLHKKFKTRLNDTCYNLFKDAENETSQVNDTEALSNSQHSLKFLEYIEKHHLRDLSRNFSIVISPIFETQNERQLRSGMHDDQLCHDEYSALDMIHSWPLIEQKLQYIYQHESLRNLIQQETQITPNLFKLITHREVHKRLDKLIPLRECWNGSVLSFELPQHWHDLENFAMHDLRLKLIAHPYNYFFQYDADDCVNMLQEEDSKDSFITVTRKYLGTMCMLFYFNNEWRISTNQVNDDWKYLFSRTSHRFNEDQDIQQQFWNAFHNSKYELPAETHMCFMFTLTFKPFLNHGLHNNQRQDQQQWLIAHGCRDMNTLKEHLIETYAQQYHWKTAEVVDTISKNPYLEIVKNTKYKPKKRAPTANPWRKKPDDLCVNLPLLPVFEKYIDEANDFSCNNPELFSGFVLCDEQFNRIKVETSIFFNMGQLEIFRDSETQEESVDSENNEMLIIEMIRNLRTFQEEGIDDLLTNHENFNNNSSTIMTSETSASPMCEPIDITLVKHFVPAFTNMYIDFRNIFRLACHMIDHVYNSSLNELDHRLQSGAISEKDTNKIFPTILQEKSPVSRHFPFMYMRKHHIETCFELFTRKYYLHTEAIHGFLLECKQKRHNIIQLLLHQQKQGISTETTSSDLC
ncbi:hypothetical protein C9374_006802 [Naegleria lovaniensis]|uniref:Uncharacterized protein n=1 Tax=Naegleria lovaniensis TaxID=51637 RepID=A0AA88H3P4_NAELO|nr:uncharacterized protein C9374_006802 [Naegleria lovaniensis]KAG2393271.1 hypothetical protein C9374_006802 [Naegleria lovaniensis]